MNANLHRHQCLEEHPLGATLYDGKNATTEDPGFAKFLKDLSYAKIDVYLRNEAVKDQGFFRFGGAEIFNNPAYPHIFLMNSYKTGGTTGYDGGDSRRSYTEDDIPPFVEWRQILNLFWPDIPHLLLGQLQEAVTTRLTWNVNEYYGDSSDYLSEMVDLGKLFAVLEKQQKLTPLHNAVAPANCFEGVSMPHNLVQINIPKRPGYSF